MFGGYIKRSTIKSRITLLNLCVTLQPFSEYFVVKLTAEYTVIYAKGAKLYIHQF